MKSILLPSVAILAATFLAATSSHAAVIILSGGNAAGYAPGKSDDSADFGYAHGLQGNPVILSGVTFTGTLPANATLTTNSTFSNGIAGDSSTGDSNLNNLVSQPAWLATGPNPSNLITLTLTGLTAGKVYQLDSLLSPPNNTGAQEVLASVVQNGITVGSFDYVDHSVGGADLTADLRTTFVSDGTTVTATFATTFGDAYVNAFSLTSVPEPSTYALLAMGLAGLAIAARRRKIA